jgi:transposase
MENAAEPASRGRGLTFSKIKVNAEDQLVTEKDGIISIAGVQQPEGTAMPEVTEVDRNEWIKRQIAAGAERGAIAKMLDLSYGVIYGLTKETEGTRQKYEVEYEGKMISRSEYIRMRAAQGINKSDIAKELGVEYSVVWQATKKLKTTEEKFVEAVKTLVKFMDVVETPEALAAIVKSLEEIKVKAESKDTITEEAEEPQA